MVCDLRSFAIRETKVYSITCSFSKFQCRDINRGFVLMKGEQNCYVCWTVHFYYSAFRTLDPLIWSHHSNYRRGLYNLGGSTSKTTKITVISNRSWNTFQFMRKGLLDGFRLVFFFFLFSVCGIYVHASVLIWWILIIAQDISFSF